MKGKRAGEKSGTAEGVYRDLQKHLDKQPIGYPATKSGVEVSLLKRLFSPEEVGLATRLSYKPRPPREIYEAAGETGMSLDEMEAMLDRMMKKGVIGHMERGGERLFFNLPLLVGMYEGQLYRLTPEFLKDFDRYTSSRSFGLEFLGTAVPQMRTIPVGRSIHPEHHITTHDHLQAIIEQTEAPIVINECICRKAAALKGKSCSKTTRLETCMAFGDTAKNCLRSGFGREISKEEALEIARLNESDGLVLQPSNTREVEFVCACCGCCCGMLSVHKMLPKPADFWASNYYASVDPETCTACGTCVERCEVGAVSVNDSLGASVVDLSRCLGCGNCVSTCPGESIRLLRKEKETTPPENLEDLYGTIMAGKKGVAGKIALAARLMLKR